MSTTERDAVRGGLSPAAKRALIYAGALLVAFLLGLVPMWLSARERGRERDEARRELRLSRIQSQIAAAALDARRGDYEPARQAASAFFTALRSQLDAAGGDSDLTQARKPRAVA